jgi:hypothetical protein
MVHPTTFVEGRLANGEIEHQTRMIAAKLEAAGWGPRRGDAGDVVSIGLVTGSILRDGGWRNSNVLPATAKRNRANMLGAFQLWLAETPAAARYCRYCVISSGVRCSLDDLPKRLRWFNARLGRFVERAPSDRWQVDVQLVALEVTFEREADGGVSCNLHANIVYWPQRVLGSEGWTEFLGWMRKHFGVSQIEDTGTLAKPEEVIKYVCKPSEVMQLTSEETRFLAEALHRKQLVRTTGTFGAFCAKLREDRHKVRFDRQAKAWCRVQMRTREQVERDAVEREQRAEAVSDRKAKDGETFTAIVENQILFQTLPQARASLLAESFVGVRHYTPNPKTEAGRRNLGILEERRAMFVAMLAEKGVADEHMEAAASRLDTCTTIPPAAAIDFLTLPENRRQRILRQVGIRQELVPRYLHGGHPMELSTLIRDKLERLIPTERHPWVASVGELAAEARTVARRKAAVAPILAAFPGARVVEVIDDALSAASPDRAPPAPAIATGSLRERAMQAALERRQAEVREVIATGR